MIVCMLIGFCASPSTLKSQMVQPMSSISFLINSNSQYNFNNWFSLNPFFDSDWSSDEYEVIKADSLKKALESKSKVKCSNDSIFPKSKRSSLKKIRKKNFRNMPVVIQTRI
ncbi:MAG: hypothetical protein ACI93S_001771 [Ancylomarina sp.]|jgi:hypothetical protein